MPLDPSVLFNAPVPGVSLTGTPKSSPYEQPPQFADVEDAADFMFIELTKPRKAVEIVELLRAGVSVESLARTIAFVGAANGMWTPDVMLLLARDRLLFIIAAIGQRNKVKNIKYLEPDTKLAKRLLDIRKNNGGAELTQADIVAGAKEEGTEAAPSEEDKSKYGLLGEL